MHEVLTFGVVVLVAAIGFYLAVGTSKLTERLRVPGPAFFLLGAAGAATIFPRVHDLITIRTVERIGVVALIMILFDGGMQVGWRHFRSSLLPIASLGIAGTFATAALMALFARELFGFTWIQAGILGIAIAPTDPAVMFSVLGNKEVGGRSGTILEGESGANDPAGIALMVGMLELAKSPGGSFSIVVVSFVVEMAVGLVIGAGGGLLLLASMRRISLPGAGLYPLRTLAAAGVIYGAATVAHGSGFLAVFVAGIIVGDARAPHKASIESFHGSLATLAEITVFAALGLTITYDGLGSNGQWSDGLVLALLLAFVARPLAVGALLLPVGLRARERLFVMWSGLKGAVPILLGSLVILSGLDGSKRVYGIVFVVVAFSVVVQGASIPFVGRRLGIRMRRVETEPWDLSIRVRSEPSGVQRYVVSSGSRAAGETVRDLPIGEKAWVSLIIRGGEPVQARGSTEFEPGDEVLVLAEPEHGTKLRRVFEG